MKDPLTDKSITWPDNIYETKMYYLMKKKDLTSIKHNFLIFIIFNYHCINHRYKSNAI